MLRENPEEVLVVGAGPVGMFSALLLAENGFRVKVIDKESNTAARSYACALHPGTLKLFWQSGLGPNLLKIGRRINSIGFYEGSERRAEIRFSDLPLEFPYVLVLPQGELENVLETRLNQLQKVHLDWNWRLSELRTDPNGVVASLDKLAQTVIGYSVPDFEVVVQKRTQTETDFLVGADGSNSLVRRLLGIEYEQMGNPELFVVYEFESDANCGDEMKIILDGNTASVMWPLPANKCRWSFQISPADAPGDFPEKERHSFIIREAASEHDSRHHLLTLLEQRAPWFEGEIGEVNWSTDIEFQHRLAQSFGRNRCWLAGDAAHQTGPIGMQSMNVGLREAAYLAATINQILREKASLDLLGTYNFESRAEWQRLLGVNGPPKVTENATPWIKQHCANLQSYLPASGGDLILLLSQLGLNLNEA